MAIGDSVASDAELLAAVLAARSQPVTGTVAAASAGTEAVAEPVIAFTGVNSDRPLQTALLLLGLGFSSLALQRRRRDSTLS